MVCEDQRRCIYTALAEVQQNSRELQSFIYLTANQGRKVGDYILEQAKTQLMGEREYNLVVPALGPILEQ